MIKIIWNREDFERIQDNVLKQFNLKLTTDPNEVPEHKIGLMLTDENHETLKALVEVLMQESYQLLFPTSEGYIQVQIKQLMYLEAFGDDIYMHIDKEGSILVRQPLYQLEERLSPYHFCRIGKSYLVNITKIKYIRTSFNAKLDIELIDGTHLEVSRSFVKHFKRAIGILKKED